MGEIFQGKVRALSFMGLGITDHPNGMVFFCSGTWPGDEGRFEIISQEKRHGFARLIELSRPSSQRRKPICPHMGFEEKKCGGCSWMIADYSSQLEEKQKIVKNLLAKAKLFGDERVLKKIWESPEEFGYRNRAQVKTDGKVFGFISKDSNELAPIDDCIILSKSCRKFLIEIKNQLPNKNWEPKTTKDLNFIEFDDESSQIELNKKRPFKQANTKQNLKMQNWLTQKLEGINTNKKVLELFCGHGNFTQILSQKKFSNIVAVEGHQESIDILKDKKLENVEAHALDLYGKNSFKKLEEIAMGSEILFLDPPRSGYASLDRLIKLIPTIKEIFYVSCDLSTFIHDTKKISDKFEFVEIQPVDQFPQTPHIEILSYLRR